MPFSSTSVEPDLQPVIELAFEAAWRELRLTPGRLLTSTRNPHGRSWPAHKGGSRQANATRSAKANDITSGGVVLS